MAPWYPGRHCRRGAFGIRWVSKSNNDAFYTWLNAINNAEFRHFDAVRPAAGPRQLQLRREHLGAPVQPSRFITKTEAYFMWQRDAVVGGTPSIGPVEPFGGGGGIGADIPGTSLTYGVLNYTMFRSRHKDFITFRNEWWKDTDGERSGFAGDLHQQRHRPEPQLQRRTSRFARRSATTATGPCRRSTTARGRTSSCWRPTDPALLTSRS